MVVSTITENGTTNGEQSSLTMGIAPGDYRLVGWDMDTTGKKLTDEICQIAGYTPSSAYSQYVMPYKDLNPPAIKRHNMRVVTVGKYRMLKNSKTNKVLKTKSEVSALTDFLTWLESVKGDAADGVILLYHEPRKVIPAMVLESLQRYNLVERFKQTVRGFANGFNIAEAKCTNSVHTFSLRTLSRTLLKRTEELDNAKDRAYLALQVLQHISLQENTKVGETSGSGDSDTAMKSTIEFIQPFVQPIHIEEEERAKLKVVFERQNSLRPIFGPLFKASRKERQHASPLRRLLAEAGIEYSQLQEAWSNGQKQGLEKLIKEKLTAAEDKKIEDLIKVLESYFDPEKNSKAKMRHEKKETKSESSKIIDDRENNNKCDSGTETPDTTSSSPINTKLELPEIDKLSLEN
ncbi:maternal protein exuperantia-like [Vespa mandarinia]|uniref:maternal protein exuperantia-like n=1 Tax=Vespa mandarinia TaxID=7446 RepID=UPI00160E306A|nr:maternal protein exuperantia-like [Vespa mandarinia]XP_035729111.1 maternal protein exuperantia-like [Vespa mandarinia]XP_035729112.1 maternal protein exuperantia-like [Vespa mandarinia]XP_035729113.1 maternal protein exuperantia-like [Vespa mandarinia]XP_035729116.1 maternal protein exuperantia-like [Vespa mandarinia]XP_047357026.1 maternal protein exuperantia [Vespa velutina]XP_047357027.1 maternal protein exuperantia [Vespa velutina]XP_047357028.1 maternal protein exuperantia [Vespa ve